MINFSKNLNIQIESITKNYYPNTTKFDNGEYVYMTTKEFDKISLRDIENCISQALIIMDNNEQLKEKIMTNFSLKRYQNRGRAVYYSNNFLSKFLASEINPFYHNDLKENFEKQLKNTLNTKALNIDFEWNEANIYPKIYLSIIDNYNSSKEEILQLKQLIASFYPYKRVVKREYYSYDLTRNNNLSSFSLRIYMKGEDISKIKAMKY